MLVINKNNGLDTTIYRFYAANALIYRFLVLFSGFI